ncbi:MAG: hypothetical protein FWF02_03385 [Micrococcales bacterium]|nr:hypothetical protein [Micrococcales bacterium]MCL2666731.1 hypothetical protein [Micrococcales bacterium]
MTIVRKSVPLADEHLALLRTVGEPGTPERLEVERVTGPLPEVVSESRILASLIDYARRSLAEARLNAGYAALAATTDADDDAHAQAVRSRRHRMAD